MKNINIKLFKSFFKIGILTFGGGLAMLPMLKREVVEKNNWASEDEILEYYAIGQCTPGIIAVNTATFIGYKENKIPGAIFSTLGIISPSIIIISLVASILKIFMSYEIVNYIMIGVRIGVSALLLSVVIDLIEKADKKVISILLTIIAALFSLFLPVSTVIIVIVGGVVGFIKSKIGGVN